MQNRCTFIPIGRYSEFSPRRDSLFSACMEFAWHRLIKLLIQPSDLMNHYGTHSFIANPVEATICIVIIYRAGIRVFPTTFIEINKFSPQVSSCLNVREKHNFGIS